MKVQVVAAVIVREHKFLLGKRAEWKKSAPGYWCPVSGGIETGETEEEAVVREIFEEVGCEAKAVSKITEFDTHDGKGRIHWWLAEITSGEPYLKNDEHSELGWFTLAEMEKLDKVFAEDLELYRSLK